MSDRNLCAVVPVKPLAEAKGRLATVLAPPIRRRLVLTMLHDVLGALRAVPTVARVLVVTADGDVAARAEAQGAQIVAEREAQGLNAGVAAGVAAATRLGFGRTLVLPADLPFATADDIMALAGGDGPAQRAQIAMVPAADGCGTNALLLSPPDAIRPSFGPGSFLAHLGQALARRIDVNVLHLKGLSLDIDRPGDLAQLATLDRYAFLDEHNPSTRVEIRRHD